MRWSISVLVLCSLAACSREPAAPPAAQRAPASAAAGRLEGEAVNLPKQVGAWVRPDAPRRVTAETIFDYMDGGGELYLAYRFDHLDVVEYKAADPSRGTILVELYRMKTSDDAFGLLSTDWGGEQAAFDSGPRPLGFPAIPSSRALYGAGLLRIWNGSLYVRILAARETPESREAVLTLGRELTRRDGAPTTGGTRAVPAAPPGLEATAPVPRPPAPPPPLPPAILENLALSGNGARPVRPERTVFFRSYLVLNSAYFLASDDILGLGLDVDAVTAEYKPSAPGDRPIRVILVRYPGAARARSGLQAFVGAYLPEAAANGTPAAAGASHVEHGWVGWASKGQDLVIALDAPSAKVARDAAGAVLADATASAGAAR